MKSFARGYEWWPGMDGGIEKVSKSCEACHQAKQGPAKAPLNPWPWPSRPWQRVHLDFAGPFLGKSFLLEVDTHSKWGKVFEMTSTILLLKPLAFCGNYFEAYGLPQQLVGHR